MALLVFLHQPRQPSRLLTCRQSIADGSRCVKENRKEVFSKKMSAEGRSYA